MNGFFLRTKNILRGCVTFIRSYPVICSFFAGLLAKSAFSSGEHVMALVMSVEIFYFILNHLYTTKSYGRSFLAGYMYGLGLYAGIMYWETYLHDYGIDFGHPKILTMVFYFFSVAYVAIYYAFVTYASARLAFNKLSLLLFWSVFITLSEILQCHVVDGYPFTIIAYGSHGIPYFSNIASVFGSYGVTLLFLSIIALLNTKKTAIVGILLFSSIIGYNFYRVNRSNDYRQQENDFEVTIVQPNFDHKTRTYRDYRANCDEIADLADVSRSVSGKRLIISPETIIRFDPDEIKYFQRSLLKKQNVYAMTGFIDYVVNKESFGKGGVEYDAYNTIHVYRQATLDSGGTSERNNKPVVAFRDDASYRKKHLIIFSEFFPEWLFTLAQLLPDSLAEMIMTFDKRSLCSGKDKNTIKLSGIDQFDMNICYDIVLPGQAMDDPLLSTWMVNVINLHNYCSTGISDLAHQQNVICKFRAMEFGKPIAVCANFGYSCFIDCNGNIIQCLDPQKPGAIHQKFNLKYRITAFCKYKNTLLYIVIILLLLVLGGFKMFAFQVGIEHKRSLKTNSDDE